MRVPLSWLAEFVTLPETTTADDVAKALTFAGLEVETIDRFGDDVSGPVVVGRVLEFVDEPQKNGKIIRWCRVDVGDHNPAGEAGRGIVCGAHNFEAGDHVVVALPGAVLAGGFEISSRKTYGHLSDGMICAADELGIGEDHTGIIVLPATDDASLVPGEPVDGLLGLHEAVLDIALTPDLGYCQSIRGVAREAGQALGATFTDPVVLPVPEPISAGHPVRIDSDLCSVFVALGVDGVDPAAPSPAWMVRRLEQCGMRSISLAVDVTNYVMLELGQPLHAYDAEKLAGPIVVRTARAEERLVTLDDAERALEPGDLLICDDSGPIGLAGVMGGLSTEVTDTTRSLIIEAAAFDPITVARTSRRLNLTSEASRRFERGSDPGATYAAAHRVVQLLCEHGGGVASPLETVAGTVPVPPSTTIDASLPARVLGADVSREETIDALSAGKIEVTALGEALTLTPPTWRPDLRDPNDYAEEVGRKVGLDRIQPRLPVPPAGGGRTREQRLRRELSRALADAGLVEVLTMPFVADRQLDALGLDIDDERRRVVALVNPLSDEQPFVRTTLLPGLADAVVRNASRSATDVAVFEIGRVFRQTPDSATTIAPLPGVDARPSEEELATIARSLPDQPRFVAGLLTGMWRAGEAATWRQAIALAQAVGRVYGVELERRAASVAPFHPGRCAELSVDGVVVGYAGELHPRTCEALDLAPRTVGFELALDPLLGVDRPRGESAVVVSPHPVTKEDVALIVDGDVPVAAVERALRDGAGPLLEQVTLFDIYTGEQAGDGRKSLAFSLRFRAPDRTLKQEEASAAKDAAVAVAAERLGAVQRA